MKSVAVKKLSPIGLLSLEIHIHQSSSLMNTRIIVGSTWMMPVTWLNMLIWKTYWMSVRFFWICEISVLLAYHFIHVCFKNLHYDEAPTDDSNKDRAAHITWISFHTCLLKKYGLYCGTDRRCSKVRWQNLCCLCSKYCTLKNRTLKWECADTREQTACNKDIQKTFFFCSSVWLEHGISSHLLSCKDVKNLQMRV